MDSVILTQQTSRALKVAFAICVAAGLALVVESTPALRNLFSSLVQPRPAELSGVVLAAGTKAPIEGALVAVESSNPNADKTSGSYVRTDAQGRFKAAVAGTSVSVSAWKQGYAMSGRIIRDSAAPDGVTIELREMTPTNWVPNRDAFYDLKPGAGFSFSLGKVVGGDSPEADVVISQKAGDVAAAIIEARGDGGIIFQPYDGGTDFYNSPEAPQGGYKTLERFDPSHNPSEDGLYFVRTRDGKHYAKFRLGVNVVKSPSGDMHLDFEHGARLMWAYQPDGTRNLELIPDEGVPFPFYKFNLHNEEQR